MDAESAAFFCGATASQQKLKNCKGPNPVPCVTEKETLERSQRGSDGEYEQLMGCRGRWHCDSLPKCCAPTPREARTVPPRVPSVLPSIHIQTRRNVVPSNRKTQRGFLLMPTRMSTDKRESLATLQHLMPKSSGGRNVKACANNCSTAKENEAVLQVPEGCSEISATLPATLQNGRPTCVST